MENWNITGEDGIATSNVNTLSHSSLHKQKLLDEMYKFKDII